MTFSTNLTYIPFDEIIVRFRNEKKINVTIINVKKFQEF